MPLLICTIMLYHCSVLEMIVHSLFVAYFVKVLVTTEWHNYIDEHESVLLTSMTYSGP